MLKKIRMYLCSKLCDKYSIIHTQTSVPSEMLTRQQPVVINYHPDLPVHVYQQFKERLITEQIPEHELRAFIVTWVTWESRHLSYRHAGNMEEIQAMVKDIWAFIGTHQVLSMKFIRDYISVPALDIIAICKYQKLTYQFMETYLIPYVLYNYGPEKVTECAQNIFTYQKLPKTIKSAFQSKFDNSWQIMEYRKNTPKVG